MVSKDTINTDTDDLDEKEQEFFENISFLKPKMIKKYRVSYYDEMRSRWVLVDEFDSQAEADEFIAGGQSREEGLIDVPMKKEVTYTWTTPT